MLISLALRGLLRPRVSAIAGLLLLLTIPPAQALDSSPNAAIDTRLGYIVSGDSQVDSIARAGLEGLSEYVNARTAAMLFEPDAVQPGQTDLSLYPLLYWPITADAPDLTSPQAAALNDYMSRGGIIVIDTRDSGSGAGFAPGTEDALRRIARSLIVPPLAPLTGEHVLSHAFYLLSDFPGRFTGDTVWVQRDQDRTNDSVSPVIIGGNDWAAAWAINADGNNPYAVHPRRPAAAGPGLSFWRQPGDVRADRQLQRRPGPRAGHPSAAGPVDAPRTGHRRPPLRPAAAGLAADRPRRRSPWPSPALGLWRAARARRCGSPPSPCCCSGSPAPAWCRKPAIAAGYRPAGRRPVGLDAGRRPRRIWPTPPASRSRRRPPVCPTSTCAPSPFRKPATPARSCSPRSIAPWPTSRAPASPAPSPSPTGSCTTCPKAAPGGAPLNLLLTGKGEETDRRLRVIEAPGYGIVGKSVTLRVAIDDLGVDRPHRPRHADRPPRRPAVPHRKRARSAPNSASKSRSPEPARP